MPNGKPLLSSTACPVGHLCLTSPAESEYLLRGPDVILREFPPVGARADDTLALVGSSQPSLHLGTTRRVGSAEPNALPGAYLERRSQRLLGP